MAAQFEQPDPKGLPVKYATRKKDFKKTPTTAREKLAKMVAGERSTARTKKRDAVQEASRTRDATRATTRERRKANSEIDDRDMKVGGKSGPGAV